MLPIGSTAHMPGIPNSPASSQPSFASKCMKALSTYLGSQLSVQGIWMKGDMKSDEISASHTALRFQTDLATERTSVHIHLIRGNRELILRDMVLPPDHDPLDMLFRAVATSAKAASKLQANTPLADDDATHALRRKILSETGMPAKTASQTLCVPPRGDGDARCSNADFSTDEAGFDLSRIAIEAERRPQPSSSREIQSAPAGMATPSARMSMLSEPRPHVVPRAARGAATELTAELATLLPPYTLRQTIKRPNLSESASTPAKVRAAPAIAHPPGPAENADTAGHQQ